MNNQVLERSLIDIDLGLNEKRVEIILDKLLTFKNITSKSQVASMILFTLLKNINNIMKLNDNRYLLWAYIYCGIKRIEDKTQVFMIEEEVEGKKVKIPSSFEKDLCSMLLNQISDLLEVHDVFHKSVESFYKLINTEEEENEYKFLLSVLENIEANNIYVQHIDILLNDYKLVEEEKVRGGEKEKRREKVYKKDYIKVLKPLLESMFIHYGDFDESKGTYQIYLKNKLTETQRFIDDLKKKFSSGAKSPSERGLK